jgi:hypothetical protein
MAPKCRINRTDGRQYLVEQQLPQLRGTKGDPLLRKTIIWGLFETNDRISQSAVADPVIRQLRPNTNAARTILSNNVVNWAVSVTQMLTALEADIHYLEVNFVGAALPFSVRMAQ